MSNSSKDESQLHDLIILGAGPAGFAAGIYAGRARLSTLVLDGMGGGGQMATTDIVENYPSLVEPISGSDLGENMRKQMEGFGLSVTFDQVEEISLKDDRVELKGAYGTYQGKALLVATGADHRNLGVPGENKLKGHGVSYCATCDGAFFKDQDVIVVGGGDTAIKDAVYLSRIVKKITVIHRRDELRAEKVIQEKAFNAGNIEFEWFHVVDEILGDKTVTGVKARNVKTGDIKEIKSNAVFVFIGVVPNTQMFKDKLDLDEGGYIKTDVSMQTSHPRVWAAGDVRAKSVRQIGTAVGDGITALMNIEEFLNKN